MNCTNTPEMAEKILDNIGKLKVADHARLMADNQTTLDRSNRSDEAHRDYTQRVREAQARKLFGENWEPPIPQNAGGEDVQIFIDSPITVTHPNRATGTNDPPPSPTAAAMPSPVPPSTVQPAKNGKPSWLLPLALAGALGTGAAIPLALSALRPNTEATPAVTNPIEFPAYDVEKWVP